MRTALRTALPTLGLLALFGSIADCLAGQIATSLQVPILGYVLDAEIHSIRPITGIPGSSRLDAPIPLPFAVANAAFLPDERHALIDSPGFDETLILDLSERSHSRITGTPSSVSALRTSSDGTKAALYYASNRRLLVVSGIPSAAAVQHSIDLSSHPSLRRLAISNDGMTVLLVFHGEESDELHRWTARAGLSLVTRASTISDVIFTGGDAVFADSGSHEIVLLRNIGDQISVNVIASASDDVLQPSALALSSRHELLIGTPDSILVMDLFNQTFRKLSCSCNVTTIARLHDSSFRLTDELDRPMFILDGRTVPERILFVPALPVEKQVEP